MLQTKATSWVGSIFQPFISLLVKIWHWNKSARSKLNPVHSSKSRSTTCTRLGRLFRFQWNSTPTSDDCVLSFKTILAWVTLTSNWNQSLQPKQLNMKLMKDDIRKPCRDLKPKFAAKTIENETYERWYQKAMSRPALTGQAFNQRVFMSNEPLKIIIHYVVDQSLATCSRRSVLTYRLPVLTFLRFMALLQVHQNSGSQMHSGSQMPD